jgi:AcrR family transcriptional regulator
VGRIAGVTAEQTKERLIDAAARVFETNGFAGSTVAEIAREAGLTSGAIYGHYASKAELLADALRCHGERATASLLPPGTNRDAATVLIALGTRLGARDRADTALLFEALLASKRDAELSRVLALALAGREARLADVIADGQREGVLTHGVPATAAARFAIMLGLGSMLVNELDLPDVDQAEWTSFIRRLIGAFTQEQTA